MESYEEVEDKGLFWEMVKMEVRAYYKIKTQCKRDEEKHLSWRLAQLSTKLQKAHSEGAKTELEQIKVKLSALTTKRMQGAVVRTKAHWYEHGKKINTFSI